MEVEQDIKTGEYKRVEEEEGKIIEELFSCRYYGCPFLSLSEKLYWVSKSKHQVQSLKLSHKKYLTIVFEYYFEALLGEVCRGVDN